MWCTKYRLHFLWVRLGILCPISYWLCSSAFVSCGSVRITYHETIPSLTLLFFLFLFACPSPLPPPPPPPPLSSFSFSSCPFHLPSPLPHHHHHHQQQQQQQLLVFLIPVLSISHSSFIITILFFFLFFLSFPSPTPPSPSSSSHHHLCFLLPVLFISCSSSSFIIIIIYLFLFFFSFFSTSFLLSSTNWNPHVAGVSVPVDMVAKATVTTAGNWKDKGESSLGACSWSGARDRGTKFMAINSVRSAGWIGLHRLVHLHVQVMPRWGGLVCDQLKGWSPGFSQQQSTAFNWQSSLIHLQSGSHRPEGGILYWLHSAWSLSTDKAHLMTPTLPPPPFVVCP